MCSSEAEAAGSAGPGKAAFVAVVGRPSAGKSTLVNRACAAKVAIVSPVPQTTRNAVRGILNSPRGQLVFVDTPGRHNSNKKLNKRLMAVSDRAINDADIMLYVLDASRPPGPEEEAVALALRPWAARTLAAVNKMDSPAADCGRCREFLRASLPDLPEERCFTLSALKKTGLAPLLDGLFDAAPGGEPFYPKAYTTDQEISFRIAEIIREKAVNRLYQELPHCLYVEVADLEARDGGARLWVRAFIITERESQKGMVVGKGGAVIKAIRQAAGKDLNRVLDLKVDLDLRVKSSCDWRHNDGLLRKLIG
ncbi:MAG: GTPase Era [Spirochaetaceae bacterium]|jgi:GTP-binding protein Era|nr:GTPase Era [Spirochaetaceae bacterium]